MRRFKTRIVEDEQSIDLTPMLDVVFIMLIFFIVTASFVRVTGVDVNRPSATTAQKKDNRNILVAIQANGEIWMDKRRIDIRSVRSNIERLRVESPEGAVIIQADEQATAGLIVEVMDAARAAGVYDVSLAAER